MTLKLEVAKIEIFKNSGTAVYMDVFTDRWGNYWGKVDGKLITPFEFRRKYKFTLNALLRLCYKETLLNHPNTKFWKSLPKSHFDTV